MFEIILLIVVSSAVAAYARARGGTPWIWGFIAVSGYLVLNYAVPGVFRIRADSDLRFGILVAGFSWMGVVALCARFLLGHGRAKPGGMWSCRNCKYLNAHYAVLCEACQRPYPGDVAPPEPPLP